MVAEDNKHLEEIKAYEEDITDNLSVEEALILIAICAAKTKSNKEKKQSDDAKIVSEMARKHPIFSDSKDCIDPTINKFMNMIGATTDLKSPVESAAKVLNREQKEIAFSWAAEIIMPDGFLSETRKNILDKYVFLLDIDKTVAKQILVEVSN